MKRILSLVVVGLVVLMVANITYADVSTSPVKTFADAEYQQLLDFETDPFIEFIGLMIPLAMLVNGVKKRSISLIAAALGISQCLLFTPALLMQANGQPGLFHVHDHVGRWLCISEVIGLASFARLGLSLARSVREMEAERVVEELCSPVVEPLDKSQDLTSTQDGEDVLRAPNIFNTRKVVI